MISKKISNKALLLATSLTLMYGEAAAGTAHLYDEAHTDHATGGGILTGSLNGSLSSLGSGAATTLSADLNVTFPKGLYSILAANSTAADAAITDAASGSGAFNGTFQSGSTLQLIMAGSAANINLSHGTWTLPTSGTYKLRIINIHATDSAAYAQPICTLGTATSSPFSASGTVEIIGGPIIDTLFAQPVAIWKFMDGLTATVGTSTHISQLGGAFVSDNNVKASVLLPASVSALIVDMSNFSGIIAFSSTNFTVKNSGKTTTLRAPAGSTSIAFSSANPAYNVLDLSSVTSPVTVTYTGSLSLDALFMPTTSAATVTLTGSAKIKGIINTGDTPLSINGIVQ